MRPLPTDFYGTIKEDKSSFMRDDYFSFCESFGWNINLIFEKFS